MKFFKMIILYFLLLIAMILCAAAVMKVLDAVLKLGCEDIWAAGCKVGFVGWLLLLAGSVFKNIKKTMQNR